MTPVNAARLQVLGVAMLFSTGGAAIKFCSLTAWQVASFRSGIAALTLLLLAPGARRRPSPWPTAVAAVLAATMVLYVLANKLTTAASAIFLQSTSPLYVLLLGPWLLREPIRRSDLAVIGAMAVGMAMFFVGSQPTGATAPDPLRGNLMAIVSGASYALAVVGLRWLSRGGDSGAGSSTVALANLMAFAACLPLALPVVRMSAADAGVLLYLGVFQVGIAYLLLTAAMRHLGAFETSLLLLVEPVLNPVWAWLVQGERPTAWALAGGALILAATAVKTRLDYRPLTSTASPGGTPSGPGAH